MARKAKVDKPPKFTEDEKIIQEAYERFKRCQEWEGDTRNRFIEDMKFVNGDPDNGYQWPIEVRKSRDVDRKPCLTINKTRQYCLDVINDGRQNKPSVKVRPVGNQATMEGAQVMEGIVRHIEYQSNAQAVYDRARNTQVPGGVGYWRITTDYAGADTFDQEIYIRPIKDALGVFIDPDVLEPDCSDMRFAFVFEDVPRDQIENEYPQIKDNIGQSPLQSMDWLDDKHVRRCEYYRRTEKYFKLIYTFDQQTGKQAILRDDQVPSELLKPLMDDPNTKTREACEHKVEWFKIVGDKIVEKSVWAGSTIPIVRIVGEESVIEGKYDRKGHVRNLKDPQRMYNYWTSSAVEFVALQSKSPYIAPAAAIEGYETYWRDANVVNHSVLPFNHVTDEGEEIPPPKRQDPPVMADGFIKGMMIAQEEFRMASGQYQEDLGEPSNADSGRAIIARQRQGDNATYHFLDNEAMGIRYTGKILIELIPKIYDTQRVIKILGEDGTESSVLVDPNAKQEVQKQKSKTEDKVRIIFNPGFAEYAVEADVGPAYATRRQEAFNAFTQIMSQQPELMKVAGDLMFRAADFPMADELAERMKKLVPPAVLGKGPSPAEQQLTMENQQLKQNLQALMEQFVKAQMDAKAAQLDAKGAKSDRMIEAYRAHAEQVVNEFKAITDRLKIVAVSPTDALKIAADTAREAQAATLPQ